MGKSRSQDIIEALLGRGHSAPEAFVLGRWASWMRLRPRPVPTRRDALLAVLAARPLSRPLPLRRGPHWWALLCWQMGPEPAPDQRWQRRAAAVFSIGLHGLFVLLLVWVALVRSTPQAHAPEQRVALRFVSAGQGHENGQVEAPADDAVAAPVPTAATAPTGAGRRAGGPAPAQTINTPAELMAPAADNAPAPLAASPAPTEAVPLPAPTALPVSAPALVVASSSEVTASQQPQPSLPLPAPLLRPITPRAVDFALEAEVDLPVVERELELAQQVQLRPARPVPVDVEQVALPEVRVPERSIALRQQAPQAARLATAAPLASSPAVALGEMAVREREVSVLQAAPSLSGVRQTAPLVRSPGAPALAVAEREIPLTATAPALRGVRPEAAADRVVQAGVPTVRERQVSERAPAPELAGIRGGQASTEGSVPPAPALAVRERSVAGERSGAAAPVAADAAGRPAVGPAAAAAVPAAGSAQDWSRAAAVSDDWSRAGRSAGQADGVAATGMPAGLRAADLPVAAATRGAPDGENDQWTRQRLEAGGTWLRRPPPGHTAGRFDRYWVPNESLLAEWVRKGIKNVDIPLPGGSGSISCVISLLQLGGGCGVTDPNMAEQPARARAAPDIPFKPSLHNDSGSP